MPHPIKDSTPEPGNAPRLLEALRQLTGVACTTAGDDVGILVRRDPSLETAGSTASAPALHCAGSRACGRDSSAERVEIRFSDDPEAPWPFRGRTVSTTLPVECTPLALGDGERVLASTRAGPLWVVKAVAGRAHYRSALAPQEIPPGGSFAQVFSGVSFMANLPLLQLLARSGSSGIGIEHPPRASFMFDDPNLHWSTYGYVHYACLSKQAKLENFHVSFATIPLDAWYAHPATARQFRDNPGRLSLLVHGNNHTRHELAREASTEGCSALLHQARNRIERLERRARVGVDRVMVPPHGACSATMLAALPAAGFQGACLSSGSLAAHNPQAEWLTTLGFRPAEQILGCAVLPRWAIVGIDPGELLVAAYLGRPMILRGHHGDLREGAELLSRAARFINGLGEVAWLSNADLMRSSFQMRMTGDTAHIRPFAKEVVVTLPPRATAFVIEPAMPGLTDEPAGFSCLVGGKLVRARCREAVPLSETANAGGNVVRVTRVTVAPKPHPIPLRGIDASSVLRRILTETRDRLMPLANRHPNLLYGETRT